MKGIILRGKLVDKYLELIGASGQMLFPFCLIRNRQGRQKRHEQFTEIHEQIHFQQALEMLVIPFYIWILIEYAIWGLREGPLETECYGNQLDVTYLSKRKRYNWLKFKLK